MFRAVLEIGNQVFWFSVELDVWQPPQDLLKDGGHLTSSNVSSQTEVRAGAKCDVVIWGSFYVELLWVSKNCGISIRSDVVHNDFVVLSDADAS
jgi:hypothetical protein